MTMPDPGPVVTIGLKEIYDQLVSLNTKVEVLMGEVADTDKAVADHETRIRSLERGRWPITSLTVLLTIASVTVALLAWLTR